MEVMGLQKMRILSVLMIVLLCFTMILPINVNALYSFDLSGSDETYMQEVLEYVNDVVADGHGLNTISGYVGPDSSAGVETELFYKADTGSGEQVYLFNKLVYEGLPKKRRKDTMQAFATAVNSKPFSVEAKQKLYYALLEQEDVAVTAVVDKIMSDTSADMSTAVAFIGKYGKTIRVVNGVLVFAMVILFVLSTVLDFIYINIPLISTKFPPNRRSVFSKAARKAVTEKYQNDGGDSNLYYLQQKILPTIFFAVVLSIFISGKLGDILVWLVQFFT